MSGSNAGLQALQLLTIPNASLSGKFLTFADAPQLTATQAGAGCRHSAAVLGQQRVSATFPADTGPLQQLCAARHDPCSDCCRCWSLHQISTGVSGCTGSMPAWGSSGGMQNLTTLTLSNTTLAGSVPQTLGRCVAIWRALMEGCRSTSEPSLVQHSHPSGRPSAGGPRMPCSLNAQNPQMTMSQAVSAGRDCARHIPLRGCDILRYIACMTCICAISKHGHA